MQFRSQGTRGARALLFLALLASLLSFAKFDHCRVHNWASPDSYIHACYSDIPVLFFDRNLDTHNWSYSGSEKAVEYPVVTGAVMWATTWLVHDGAGNGQRYFDINVILIAALLIALVLLVWKMNPQFSYLLPFSPAVIASLYINWDLWGIISMVVAIYFFDRGKIIWSASFLGLSIATKFFPVLLLLPIAVILWRRKQRRSIFTYLFTSAVIWLALNAPVFLTTPTGWWHFYRLNLEREADWGSLWYAFSLLGFNPPHMNLISLLLMLGLLAAIAYLFMKTPEIPQLALVSFIPMATILCVGKVYSPQYVLWLVPLAVLALRDTRQIKVFWIWQGAELLYHLAIWQHLALVTGAHFGLPGGGYALISIIRILFTGCFIAIFALNTLKKGEDLPFAPLAHYPYASSEVSSLTPQEQ